MAPHVDVIVGIWTHAFFGEWELEGAGFQNEYWMELKSYLATRDLVDLVGHDGDALFLVLPYLNVVLPHHQVFGLQCWVGDQVFTW